MAGERIDAGLRGRQGKLLFAFLALARGRWTSRRELAEAVWGEAAVDRSADLSVLLSRLRSALPAGAIAGRGQVRLELPEGSWIDVEAAFEAASRAEAAIARERWRESWAPAHAALSITERELLPGLEAPWIDDRRRELEDLRLEVLESVARTGLRLGGSELGAAERAARRLVDLSPLRESGHVLLMEIQNSRGNRGEALRTYDALRVRLRDELGTSPGAAAREAHDRLLRPDERQAPAPLPPAPSHVALPRALTPPVRARFVGRERDLDRMRLLIERARDIPCQVALVSGEAGIGKSRLIRQAAAVAVEEEGVAVLYGRAEENGALPYRPFVDALRGAPGDAGGDEIVRLLSDDEAVPESAESPVARLRFFDAVSNLIGEKSGGGPLVLALDDLHWADEPTLLLLRHLARDQARSRLLLVLSLREGEQPRADVAAAVADLSRDVPVERFRLRPLSSTDIAAIAEEASGGGLATEAVRAIGRESEGNPFFAQELAAHLAADAGGGLPEGVSEVIRRRAGSLDERTRAALSTAAVLGREFDLELLADVGGLSSDDAVAIAEEALGARLLEEVPGQPGRFLFAHALIRSVLYDDLSSARRTLLHAAVADALERRRPAGGPPGLTAEIALHALAALPRGDANRAVALAGDAARESMTLLAYEDAVEHCRRGLDAIDRHLSKPGDERLGLLVQLGDAQRLAGRMVEARGTAAVAIEEARSCGDAEALALGVLAHGGAGFESAYVDDEMVALLEEALAAVGDADSELRVRLLSRLAKALHYAGVESDREKRTRLGREAMEMAERLGTPRAELVALEGSHFALCQPDNLDNRLTAARRIVELAAEVGDVEFGLLGRYFLIADLVETGDLEAADAEIASYGERASEVASPLHRWYHSRFLAMRALLGGELDEAQRRAQEAFELGVAVEPKTATMHFGTQMWILARERGNLAEMEAPAREFVSEYPAVPAWRLGLTWVLLDQGRREDAAEVYREFTDAGFENIAEDAIWTLTIALAAELGCRGLADAEALRTLARRIEPYADRIAVSGEAIISGGPMSLPLGMVELALGERDAARLHLGQALATARRIGAEPFAMRAEAKLAELDAAA
jgi:DNA-binding SARP family transcriptional activator